VSAAEERAREASLWDALAERRDRAAAARDRAAEARDAEMAGIEGTLAEWVRIEIKHLLSEERRLRVQAASDRAHAGHDRRLAARDRARAAHERHEALEALQGAHFDDLTGAHRRGFGEDALRAEIERARRDERQLVLAIIDVDGLKEVNDTQGHLAGDQLLRDVVDAIRSNIRSYEPVVRLGGDEFAFVVGGVDSGDMAERCSVIRADLARRPSGGAFTLGAAELRPDSDLSDLLERADAALMDARSERGVHTPAR
jgi:diguanylate cyclase (GGDEF)-like protein